MERIEARERNSPNKLKEISNHQKKERSSLDIGNYKTRKGGFHERKMSHAVELPQNSMKQLNYHGSQSPNDVTRKPFNEEASRNITN